MQPQYCSWAGDKLSENIQKIIDGIQENGVAEIPEGEYEGPVIIGKSCTVKGNGSVVIWSASGPAVVVKAEKVRLENLKIEMTSDDLPPEKNISLCCRPDTEFNNVELSGAAAGIPYEEQYWGLPKKLSLGIVPAEGTASFSFEVYVPVKAEIKCDMYGIALSADTLTEGANNISLTVTNIKSGMLIYGNIFIVSSATGIIRKIILNGITGDTVSPSPADALLFSFDANACEEHKKMLENFDPDSAVEQNKENEYSEYVDIGEGNIHVEEINEYELNNNLREENIYITPNTSIPLAVKKYCIELGYSSSKIDLDIEGYMFMLGADGKVKNNSGMIFFGNVRSKCGSVLYIHDQDKRSMVVDIGAIPEDITRMVLIFSIYGKSPVQTFDKLVDGEVSILCENGVHMHLALEKNIRYRTILAIGFDKRDGIWELIPSGKGASMPLEDICRSYGVNII